MLRGSDGVAHQSSFWVLAESGILPSCGGVFDIGGEALALGAGVDGDPGKFAECGVKIDKFDDSLTAFPFCQARCANDERNTGVEFEIGVLCPRAEIT